MSGDSTQIVHSSRLRGSDVARLGVSGLRARPMRAVLSALGIAIGIAAMVGVVGVSASSQAQLHEQLQALGTNMLTALVQIYREPILSSPKIQSAEFG